MSFSIFILKLIACKIENECKRFVYKQFETQSKKFIYNKANPDGETLSVDFSKNTLNSKKMYMSSLCLLMIINDDVLLFIAKMMSEK